MMINRLLKTNKPLSNQLIDRDVQITLQVNKLSNNWQKRLPVDLKYLIDDFMLFW